MKFLLLLLLPSCLAFRDLEPALPEPRTRNTPVEGWVNVRLNHFDASNNDTFPMRYYYNSEFSNASNSNVVIFVGGEWGISPNWVTGGLPYELAQELSAGLFYTEHRYYGQTRPSEGTSVAELRYLTVDQALADLLQFIQIITSDQFENGRYKGGKVSLIGCSYAGSMATWMRLAYPHTIAAAFSDSGPLHAQEDFPEYLETISEALRSQGGDSCVSSVEKGMRWVTAALESDAGAQQVSTLFNTCTPINRTNELDVATFFWFGVTETFAYLVQYATPGDIAEACNALTDTSIANAGERLAAWIRSHTSGLPCLETRYQEVVTAHRDTSYDAPDSVMRLWTYQTCVEYGWYQTTTGTEHPFLDVVPLEYFHQMCKDFFDESFDEEFLRSGIRRTNVLFAGLTHLPDGTVTVVGGADPWSPMGPNITHQTYLAPVYVVPDESHCRAVRSTDPSNPNTPLERAKRSVLSHMKSFVETNLPAETTAGAITQHSNMLLLLTAVLLIRI